MLNPMTPVQSNIKSTLKPNPAKRAISFSPDVPPSEQKNVAAFDKLIMRNCAAINYYCDGDDSAKKYSDVFDEHVMKYSAVIDKLCDGSDSDSDAPKQSRKVAKSKVPTRAKTGKRMKKKAKTTATASFGELVDTDD